MRSYTEMIKFVLCHQTGEEQAETDGPVCWKDPRYWPGHPPGQGHILSQEAGRGNHSRPLSPWPQLSWTSALWQAPQSARRQNNQTQERFLSTGHNTHQNFTQQHIPVQFMGNIHYCSIIVFFYVSIPYTFLALQVHFNLQTLFTSKCSACFWHYWNDFWCGYLS